MLFDSSIPLPLQVWLMHDDYDYGRADNYISATQLLQPTRSLVLARRMPEPDEIDLHKLIAPKMGNALHDSIEAVWKVPAFWQAAMIRLGYPAKVFTNMDVRIEQRTSRKLDNWLIGGKFDMVLDGNLFDFKSTSVWTWINGDKDEDYQLQGSIYKWLNPELITSDDLTICFIFTDWSQKDAAYKENYPSSRIKQKSIPLLSEAQIERFMKKKLKDIEKNIPLNQNEMVQCTNEELWRTAPKFKYYASGDITKRATKVFDTASEAAKYKAAQGKGTVLMVPGEPKRCRYCYAAPICEQRIQMVGGNNE